MTPEEHQRLVNAETSADLAARHAANCEAVLNAINEGRAQWERDIAAIKAKVGA